MSSMVARPLLAAIIVFPSLSAKSWTSVNEEQYGKSYAAWHWIRFYTDNTLAQASVKVDDTWNVIQPLVFAEIVS